MGLCFVYLVLLLCSCSVFAAGDNEQDNGQVFTSTYKLMRLLTAERQSIQVMKEYIAQQRAKIALLKATQQAMSSSGIIDCEHEEDLECDARITHPVNSLHVIHRFITHWKTVYRVIFHNQTVQHSQVIQDSHIDLFPNFKDMLGSYRSIIRLMDTYQLNARSVAEGRIQDRMSGPLEQEDCYFMAIAATQAGLCDEAVSWIYLTARKMGSVRRNKLKTDTAQMEEKLKSAKDDIKKNNIIHNFLTVSMKYLQIGEPIKKEMKKFLLHTKKVMKKHTESPSDMNPPRVNDRTVDLGNDNLMRERTIDLSSLHASGDLGKMLKITTHGKDLNGLDLDEITDFATKMAQNIKIEKAMIEKQDKTPYSALCRGDAKHKNNLFCEYHTPNLPYNVWKKEFMSRDPMIAMIYDFITEWEIEHLKELSIVSLKRAQTGQASYEERVQSSAWHEDDNSTTVLALSSRASIVTGLDCVSWAEMWQVGQYGLGGRYGPHLDYDVRKFKYSVTRGKVMGDRLATFMLYLNDVDAGGYTVFPKLGVYIKPVKKAAVLWYNYRLSGTPDPRTLHAACPVLLGHKWVGNKWIRLYGNEFNRPCTA